MINHLHRPRPPVAGSGAHVPLLCQCSADDIGRESGQEAALELVAGAVTREIINMKCTLTNSLATSRVKA